LDVGGSDERYCYRDSLLSVLVDDCFSLVSTLSEAKNRKLDDISEFVCYFFADEAVSFVIFGEKSSEYELVELI
jgi:hypothetical protein